MLNAKVTHRHNIHDHGLYMWEENNNIIFFHHNGYFSTVPPEEYIINELTREEAGKWINIIGYQNFRYNHQHLLLERLHERRSGLKIYSNSLAKQLWQEQSKTFILTSPDDCPICYNSHGEGDNVYSYHSSHQQHWACPTCYIRHQSEGLKPCPLCRLAF